MPLEMPDILNYLAATYATGYLATDNEFATQENKDLVTGTMNVSSNAPEDDQMSKNAQNTVNSQHTESRGLLQRLMRKLSGK